MVGEARSKNFMLNKKGSWEGNIEKLCELFELCKVESIVLEPDLHQLFDFVMNGFQHYTYIMRSTV